MALSYHTITAGGTCLRGLPCLPADITLTAYSYERILAESTNADTDRRVVGLHMLAMPAASVTLPAADHRVQCGGRFLPFGPPSHLVDRPWCPIKLGHGGSHLLLHTLGLLGALPVLQAAAI